MSVNRYKSHVLVLPEDDANRELINGFLLKVPALNSRSIQVLPIAGGWVKVRDDFQNTQLHMLRKYSECHLVLLIDFDDDIKTRTQIFQNAIPNDVCDRVYLLGTSKEPESLKRYCRISLEEIGEQLADACAKQEPGLWNNPMLAHNADTLERLIDNVKPFLFK